MKIQSKIDAPYERGRFLMDCCMTVVRLGSTTAVFVLTCALLTSCVSDSPKIPSKKEDSAMIAAAQKKADIARNSLTLSQKRILDIYTKQTKFLDRVRANGRFTSADTVSEKRHIDSLWQEYLIEHPTDVDALVLCAKFHRACGDNDAAYATFKVADSLNPNLAVVKQQLACYEAETSLGDAAYEHILEAVKLAPEVPVYNLQAAQTILFFRDTLVESQNISRKDLDLQMIGFYAKAAELAPADKLAQWRYAQSFYDVQSADWNAALKQWELVLQNFTGLNIEKQTALANKARVLVELYKDQEAEDILKDIDNPNLSDIKIALMKIINNAKTVQEADDTDGERTLGTPKAFFKDENLNNIK